MKYNLSLVFDILMKKWFSFFNNAEFLVLIYVCNEVLKKEMGVLECKRGDIAEKSQASLPSVEHCLEKATCFGILDIRSSVTKKSRIQFGRKLRLELHKKGGK